MLLRVRVLNIIEGFLHMESASSGAGAGAGSGGILNTSYR